MPIYLHGKMVDEAQPSAGMFQKNVQSFFESFPFTLRKYVFSFEFLIDG